MNSTSRLPDLLIQSNILPKSTVEKLLAKIHTKGGRLVPLLIEEGWLSEEQLLSIFKSLGIPIIPSERLRHIPQEILYKVPSNIGFYYELIPFSWDLNRNRIKVAMSDPTELSALQAVRQSSRMEVEPYAAPLTAIRWALRNHYSNQQPQPTTFRTGSFHQNQGFYQYAQPPKKTNDYLQIANLNEGITGQNPNRGKNSYRGSGEFTFSSLLAINPISENESGPFQFSSPNLSGETPTVRASQTFNETPPSMESQFGPPSTEELMKLRRELNKLRFEVQNAIQELRELLAKRLKEERVVIRGLLELLVQKGICSKEEIIQILRQYQEKEKSPR